MVIDDEHDNQVIHDNQDKPVISNPPSHDQPQGNNEDKPDFNQRLESQLKSGDTQNGIDLQAIFQSDPFEFKSADDMLAGFKDDDTVVPPKEDDIQNGLPEQNANEDQHQQQRQDQEDDNLDDFYQQQATKDENPYVEEQYEDDFEELIEEAESENKRIISKRQSQDIDKQEVADLNQQPQHGVIEETITQQHVTPLGDDSQEFNASQPVVEDDITQKHVSPLGDDHSVQPSSHEDLSDVPPSNPVDVQDDNSSIHRSQDDHQSQHSVNIIEKEIHQDENNTTHSNHSSPTPPGVNQENDHHSNGSDSQHKSDIVEQQQEELSEQYKAENYPTIRIEDTGDPQPQVDENDNQAVESNELAHDNEGTPTEPDDDKSSVVQSTASSSKDEEVFRLREALDQANSTMVQQHDRMLLNMDNKLNEKDKEIQHLKQLLEQYQSHQDQQLSSEFEQQLQLKNNEIQQLNQQLDDLKQDVKYSELIFLREQANKVNSLTVQQEYLSRQITEFTEMELYLRAQLEELQTKLDVTDRENTSLQHKLKEYQQGDVLKNQKMTEMEEELSAVSDEVQRLQNIVNEATTKSRRKSLRKSSRAEQTIPTNMPIPVQESDHGKRQDQAKAPVRTNDHSKQSHVDRQSKSKFCIVM